MMQITGKDLGFYLLLIIICLFGLALMKMHVALETSYGLQELIAILAVVAGAFAATYLQGKSKNGETK